MIPFIVLNDLAVTMDQLEYLVSCINDMELLTETSDYVVSVKEKLFALNNMIDARSNKVKIRSSPKVEESESKTDEGVLRGMPSGSANAMIDIRDNDDAESSCSDDSFVSATESIPEMVCLFVILFANILFTVEPLIDYSPIIWYLFYRFWCPSSFSPS